MEKNEQMKHPEAFACEQTEYIISVTARVNAPVDIGRMDSLTSVGRLYCATNHSKVRRE
jgi:hypothetical protein